MCLLFERTRSKRKVCFMGLLSASPAPLYAPLDPFPPSLQQTQADWPMDPSPFAVQLGGPHLSVLHLQWTPCLCNSCQVTTCRHLPFATKTNRHFPPVGVSENFLMICICKS